MGVPMAGCYCAKMPFPPFIIQFLLFVSYIQRAATWALLALGLGVLIDDDFHVPAPSFSASTRHHQSPNARSHPVRSFSTPSIFRRALPSSPYEPSPPKDECQDSDAADSCSVCLHGLEAGEEVRRLGGCRHVFHACCIDAWVDVGRRTCPLCRALLVPQEMLRQAMTATGKIFGEDTANVVTGSTLSHSSLSVSYDYDVGPYYGYDGDYHPVPEDGFQDMDVLS